MTRNRLITSCFGEYLTTKKNENPRKLLLILLALVFFSRLIFALVVWKIQGSVGFVSPDTETYVGPATALLHGAFLSSGSFSLAGTPEIFRTPGYPLLLIPAVASGHLVPFALAENFLLTMISAWLIWKILAELLADSQAAFWAGLLYCFEPVGFLHSEKLLSETAFTTVFLLSVWLLVRFFQRPNYRTLVLAALSLGCAAYIRPVPLYLGLWLAPLFLLLPHKSTWRQRISWALLFPAVLALTLVPWMVRNSSVADYDSFSSSSAWNLYFMSAAAVQAKLDHEDFSKVTSGFGNGGPRDYLERHPEQRDWSEAQIAHFWGREAVKVIRPHWALYSLIHAKGCLMVIFSPGVSEVLRDLNLYPAFDSPLSAKLDKGLLSATRWLLREYPVVVVVIPLMMALLILYYGLAIAGLRRMPLEIRILFSSLFLYFVLVSGFPAAVARYRVPVMPLVCICAGVAIANRKTRRFAMVKKEGTSSHRESFHGLAFGDFTAEPATSFSARLGAWRFDLGRKA